MQKCVGWWWSSVIDSASFRYIGWICLKSKVIVRKRRAGRVRKVWNATWPHDERKTAIVAQPNMIETWCLAKLKMINNLIRSREEKRSRSCEQHTMSNGGKEGKWFGWARSKCESLSTESRREANRQDTTDWLLANRKRWRFWWSQFENVLKGGAVFRIR